MIFDVFMRRTGKLNNEFLFEVKNGEEVQFVAFKDYEPAKLLIDGNEYVFPSKIKKIKQRNFSYKYPIKSKDTKLGFQVLRNNVVECEYYREVATIEKRFLFSKNIAFTVYAFEDRLYTVFTAGPKNESSHYYCIKDAHTKETVAIIKRLSTNPQNARAKIYFKDERYKLITAIIMTEILVSGICADADGHIVDLTAPNYISLRKEELAELDKSFVEYIEKQEEKS